MKHGFFLFVLIALVLATGCKARKNTARTVDVKTEIATESRRTDTARVIVESQFDMEETKRVDETTERETLHLDTLGRVRTIVRESISTQTGQGRVYRGQGSVVSVTGKTDSTGVVETLHATSHETTEMKTDSRPVQGFEWFWIILAGSLILIAVVYVLIRKSKI